MLPVSDIQRDQPGAEEFRSRYEALIAAKFAASPAEQDEHTSAQRYDDLLFATGTVATGLGAVHVQVAEALVQQCGGDAEVAIRDEAYMVLMNAGNREPLAFTRIEPSGA